MYKTEPCYDLDELTRRNLHVHTIHSSCAKPEMIVSDILREAVKSNIRVIAFTDHHHNKDFPILEKNLQLKRWVEECDCDIQVLYGAELSAYGIGLYADDLEVNQALDYRLYACNHYHLNFWEHPEDKSPRGYVKHQLDLLRALFDTDRADCIAHPFYGRYIRCFEDTTTVTGALTDEELGLIMTLGKNRGVSWELHAGLLTKDPVFAKRYWGIGKEVGVSFNVGTDAHRLDAVGTTAFAEHLKSLLM